MTPSARRASRQSAISGSGLELAAGPQPVESPTPAAIARWVSRRDTRASLQPGRRRGEAGFARATLLRVPESSLAPALLVAMPQLLDPNFHRAVVLLVHHDDEGTFGVVLNRATEILAPQLCQSIDIEWCGDPSAVVSWGGPVQPQTGWVLFDGGAGSDDDSRSIAADIRFAGSLDVLRDLASHPPEDLRVLLGYAGWGPGQLESELAQGAWLIAPVERETLFDVDPEAMWVHVVRGLGIEPATLVAGKGVH